MKFLIASDIHGSAKYCKMLLKAFEQEKADKMLLLGDILYHGPRNDLPEEYAPKENSKIVALRKLDRKAKLPATIFTYTFGIISSLILYCCSKIHKCISAGEGIGKINIVTVGKCAVCNVFNSKLRHFCELTLF